MAGGAYQYPSDDGSDYFSQKWGGGMGSPGNAGTGPGPGGGFSPSFGGGGGSGGLGATTLPGAAGVNVPDSLRRRYLGSYQPTQQLGNSMSSGGIAKPSASPYSAIYQGPAQSYSGSAPAGAPGGAPSGPSGLTGPPQQWSNPDAYNGTWDRLYADPHKRQVSEANDPQFKAWSQAKTQGNATGGYAGNPTAYGINSAADFGYFDPAGAPGIYDALKTSYAGEAGNRYRANAANLALQPGGQDPGLDAYNSLMSNLGTQSDLSGALSNARLAELQNQQAYAQRLAQAQGGFLSNQFLQGTQEQFSHNHTPGIGQQLIGAGGQLLGQIGGAYLGAPRVQSNYGG